MRNRKRALFVIATISLVVAWTDSSVAQARTGTPTSNGVAGQFKAGAERVGEGATQIGEGIKNGAIMTWDAMKAGAAAASAKFNGSQGSRTSRKGPAAATRRPQ